MSVPIEDHLANRQWMASALSGEIFGPGRFPGWKSDLYADPQQITPVSGMKFTSEDFYSRRYVCKETSEEILKEEAPSKRYGVGLLFPKETESEFGTDVAAGENPDVSEEESEATAVLPRDATQTEIAHLKKVVERGNAIQAKGDPDEPEDTDALGLARLRRPRSMGITFAVSSDAGPLRVEISGARYREVKVSVQPKKKEGGNSFERKIWVRMPVRASVDIDPSAQNGFSKIRLETEPRTIPDFDPLGLVLDVRIRPDSIASGNPAGSKRLVTVTLVNDTLARARAQEDQILFQSRFSVTPVDQPAEALVPLPRSVANKDAEEQSLALIYRKSHTFAMGHGCTGDWIATEGDPFARSVIAEALPVHETPPVTPVLVYPDGHAKAGDKFAVSMLPLAQAQEGWLTPLEELAELYEGWIKEKKGDIPKLESEHQDAAKRHMDAAGVCLERIHRGLELLRTNQDAAFAFRLANEAILLQQLAGGAGLRSIFYRNNRQQWNKEIALPSLNHPKAPERTWRPFQIAFLLMSLPGLWDGNDLDREIADLIWFPTGGGKTEAYLGAAAFYLISRRLQDPDNDGTGVLMRYTLRLLSSQQFQRAAGLICALETIRQREPQEDGKRLLGETPFRIGIWVGGSTTPNSHADSIEAYGNAQKKGVEEYQHVILRCPWCGSEMGPLRNPAANQPRFVCHGLRTTGHGDNRRILLHCPDNRCSFSRELPVEVVDEGIYASPPSLIIGTVDKFAMLAWRHEGRAIFGIDEVGRHQVDPPGLIIQDELHLITGPLGSMVGLYEGVIEELCTRRSPLTGAITRPKLIASTATTRASTRQIRELYAREETAVFPPPGLNADDSFFATYDRDATGTIKPGRMYLGVLARAFGSGLTVNVRVFSSLLMAAHLVPEKERDAWQTLLVFYNSLRELGANLTLFGADIPERISDLRNRWTPGAKRRFLNHILELTGRLENSEVPEALKVLERKFPADQSAVDACLASNIIEVGVDVPRLGVMAVSGQPKNTAQYIQATGRVGREQPGLVVMIYDNRKGRDLSHYEHFRDYHTRLYAQVEPSSVTPFTIQVLERALHGAFLVWVRNRVPITDQSDPRDFYPAGSAIRKSLVEFGETMRNRIDFLFPGDTTSRDHALSVFDRVLKRRIDEWEAVSVTGGQRLAVCWQNSDLTGDSADMPLIRFYGNACKPEWEPYVWPTPTSMRGVDAECRAAMVEDYQPPTDSTNSTDTTPIP